MTYSKAQNKASQKYKQKKIKRIPLDVQQEKYNQIKEHTTNTRESVNGFIKRAIDVTMESDTARGYDVSISKEKEKTVSKDNKTD